LGTSRVRMDLYERMMKCISKGRRSSGRLKNNVETKFSSERGTLLKTQTADVDIECCRLKFTFKGI
jgi:hypothetical protein